MAEETTMNGGAAGSAADASARGPRRGGDRRGDDRRGGGRGPRRRQEREPREFEQRILDLARVTRVTTGGKRMRFRVALVIGDQKGRVGFGVAKGADVQLAIQKAFHQAKRNVMTLNLVKGTFVHRNAGRFGAADVLLMPAPSGTGLKSGGAVRTILELAGVSDAVTKILGSKNKINVAKATFAALKTMVVPDGTVTDTQKAVQDRQERRATAVKKVVKKPAAKKSAASKTETTT